MSQKQPKFYVVWKGRKPGIYTTWEDCKEQVHKFKGAVYKSFPTYEQAKKAFEEGYEKYIDFKGKRKNKTELNADIEPNAIAVDASSRGNPGIMEYQGVDVRTGERIFHFGPIKYATNNIGEFLAIVHALALIMKYNLPYNAVYSDSQIAIDWVRQKKCNTNLQLIPETEEVYKLIKRAENWLKNNNFENRIKLLKWNTKKWGEIPADFNRK